MTFQVLIHDDVMSGLAMLADDSIQCCVTSPPYWNLRDYGVKGQYGLERSPEIWRNTLLNVFQEVKRVLKPGGVLWLNVGDSYASKSGGGGGGFLGTISEAHAKGYSFRRGLPPGYKEKDLIGQAWLLAFSLRESGTTGVVAKRLGRSFVGVELKMEYVRLAERRLSDE